LSWWQKKQNVDPMRPQVAPEGKQTRRALQEGDTGKVEGKKPRAQRLRSVIFFVAL
jgi:hypothetical protein